MKNVINKEMSKWILRKSVVQKIQLFGSLEVSYEILIQQIKILFKIFNFALYFKTHL